MTKCTLRVIRTVSIVPVNTTGTTLHQTSLPATLSNPRPQYSRAKLVTVVGGYGSEDRKFRTPWGVVCTPSGMVVVTDCGNDRLQMFTEDLVHVRSVGNRGTAAGQFMAPTGITTDNHGRIFIADDRNSRIQVVDEQGSHFYMFGPEGTSPGRYQFLYGHPQGITMDQNQRLYVCDNGYQRVQVVAADGRHLSTLTQIGSGQAQLRATPWCISSDSHNHVTVTDNYGNLYMFNENGEHTRTLLCSQPGWLSKAAGTVTDPWGTLLVADFKEGCVCVLGEDGQVSCRIGHKGQGPEQIGMPLGIALTNNGDLIVCDYGNHKIIKYDIPKSAN